MLSQTPCRQKLFLQRQRAIENNQIEITRNCSMLKTIVQQNGIDSILFNQQARSCNTTLTNHYRNIATSTSYHVGLVTRSVWRQYCLLPIADNLTTAGGAPITSR